MRVLSLFLCATFAFAADDMAPVGIVRGELLGKEGSHITGEVRIQIADGRIYRCTFDQKTYFERDNQRITAGAMSTGDRLEMVSDRRPGSSICYARTIHVMDPNTAKLTAAGRQRFRREASPTESFIPRGDLTFAGVVMRVEPQLLTLRTRNGEQLLLLRQDTRYLGDGMRVDLKSLKVNTRVFVRAGRNLEQEIEAYQVIWGSIVQPN